MQAKRIGRFLYFTNINNNEIELLKSILNREEKYNYKVIRSVNMLRYDEERKQYFTYFGYENYIRERLQIPLFVEYPKYNNEYIDLDKLSLNIKLRDYQKKAIIKMLTKRFGTIVASVGAGKTAIMSGFINYIKKPTLVVCPDRQLVIQNKEKFIEYGLNEDNIGVLYGEEKKLNKITIGTFATIKSYIEKYPEDMKMFKAILFEESHNTQQSETGLFIDKFYEEIAEYIIGVTGTLYRYKNVNRSISDFIMLGLTGTPLVYIPLMYLVNKGYLSKPIVYFEEVSGYSFNYKSWNMVYKRCIEGYKARNEKIVNWIKVLNEHNLTSLSLFNTKRHIEIIFDMLPEEIKEKTVVVYGNNTIKTYSYGKLVYSGLTYSKLMEDFKKPDSVYKHILATQVFSTGTDLPTLNAIILAFVGKSFVQVMQRLGRVVRKHPSKDKVLIIDFYDDTHRYLFNQTKNRINIYKKEGIPIEVKKFNINKLLKDMQYKREMWLNT